MRMKFNKSGQLLLVSAASLVAASLLTACSQLTATLTVDFVYVTSARAAGPDNYGEVDVFEINSESGHMRQIPTSPFPSGGRNPVAEAVSVDHNSLYVVNEDDNTIVQFTIGNDGKLYPQQTINTPGVFPMAVAVTSSDLFVLDTYKVSPTCSTAAPCSGSIGVLPITAAKGSTPSSLGPSPVANGGLTFWPLCLSGYTLDNTTGTWTCTTNEGADVLVPAAINVLASGSNLYVAAYDSSVTPNAGYLFGFTVGSDGALTPVNNGAPPLAAGTHPTATASDPSGSYLFITDSAKSNVLAFAIGSSTLTPVGGSPFSAGNQPSSIAIDATGKFAVIANSLDSTVNTYSISNGALTQIGTFATGLQPVAVGIDPNMNQYVYTANFLGNTVSGFQLNSSSGSLLNTQYSPFTSNAQPTAVAAIPHNGTKK
jgi:6-phosphogluconolactonase (cycloisomerase 2 family)